MIEVRDRIYSQYAESQNGENAIVSIDSLAGRASSLLFTIDAFFPRPKTSKILDVGCGYGALVFYARQRGYINVVGVDLSDQQVELAHRLGIHQVRKGDLMASLKEAEPNSLDAVVSLDVIEHFNKQELMEFADAVRYALKSGGRWIIHAPNGNSPFFGSVRYGDFTHELTFTPNSIWQVLNSTGFSRVNFAECAPRIHGFKSLVRWLFWKTIRYLIILAQASETGVLDRKSILSRNFYTIAFK